MVRLMPRTHLEPPVDESFVRQADRQPNLESDQQSQAELKLSSHLVTVVDGENISSLSILPAKYERGSSINDIPDQAPRSPSSGSLEYYAQEKASWAAWHDDRVRLLLTARIHEAYARGYECSHGPPRAP
jgi:hypothetical protein